VAIQGIGGLGHLGVQRAKELGYQVAAIAHGTEKDSLAMELGADHYIDSAAVDAAQALQEPGGGRRDHCHRRQRRIHVTGGGRSRTAQSARRRRWPRPDRGQRHRPDLRGRSIVGSLTGTAIKNEANLEFSTTHGVAPMNEVFPFANALAAYERMISGQARFRVVLDIQTTAA
jgi:D-arabinose 1-dehydrogenase-like Zn-dependent alcohol dehydrogenase